MADRISIPLKLRENNPFSSPASPLPWNNNNPDLQNLNRETSDEIEQLVRKKRLEPAVPLGGLILGEAGSGKTHMLTRILRRLRNNAQLAVFVTVKAFTAPGTVTHHLLSEIFGSLRQTHSNGRSQFDMIVSEFMDSYAEHRRNDGFDSIESLDTRVYIKKDIPNLDRNFLKCLLLYMSASDEAVKIDILDWLQSGLDDEASLRLGLPSRDTNYMTDDRREQDAENMLISLGLVLGYAKVPMIICFDQLDGMKDKENSRELITAWGNIISLLMNDLSGILPLCFMRAQTWNDVFLPVLDEAVVQRVKNNRMTMRECSIKQAQQIVHDRIASAFNEDAEEIYRWLISRMTLTQGLSPRDVIELANRIVTSPDTPITEDEEVRRAILSIYGDEYKKVQASPQAWPPNAEHLKLALEVWLSSFDGISLVKSAGKYIRVQALRGDKRFAFVIVIPKAHYTASAGLNEAMRFMREYPGCFCCYVLEEKSHKKTWKKFAENLAEFKNAGGFVVSLSKDSRINWYALAALTNRVDNGDVNIYSQSSHRAAKRSDMAEFLQTLKLIDHEALRFTPASITYVPTPTKKAPKVYYDDKLFADTLHSVIQDSPMKILAVDKAAELLRQRGINAGRNEILASVKNNYDRFRTFTSKNDVLVTLADKK